MLKHWKLILLALFCLLVWYKLSRPLKSRVDYQDKIQDLENQVDSLQTGNPQLDSLLESLDTDRDLLDQKLQVQDSVLQTIKEKTNEKIIATNAYTVPELQQFFSDRYK